MQIIKSIQSRIYEALNLAVKRNIKRFPKILCFNLLKKSMKV